MGKQSVLDLILRSKKTGSGGKQAKQELDLVQSAAKALTGVLAGVTVAAVLRTTGELLNMGVEAKRTRTALEAYAGGAREATRTVELMKAATGGALDTLSAMQNATRFMSMGLASTADEAARFTEIAVTLGATMGRGPQQAIEEFSLLLANQAILRLDTFGLSGAKTREMMLDLADSIPDRETRFLAAVLEQAQGKMELLADAGFKSSSSLDRFKAKVTDAKLAVATWLANGLLPIIDGVADLTDATEAHDKWLNKTTDGIDSQIEALEGQKSAVDFAVDAQKNYNIGMEQAAEHARDAAYASIEFQIAALQVQKAGLLSAGQMADYAAMAEAAAQESGDAVGPHLDFAAALGEIDRNVPSKIGGFLEDLRFLAAGGAEVQQAFQDLQEGMQLGLISPEDAKAQAQGIFLEAQSVLVESGQATGEEVGKAISDAFGVSIIEARGIWGEFTGTLDEGMEVVRGGAPVVGDAWVLAASRARNKWRDVLEAPAGIREAAAEAKRVSELLTALDERQIDIHINYLTEGLPDFDTGGIVPGPLGSPQLLVAHGGEEIRPVQQSYDQRFQYANFNLQGSRYEDPMDQFLRKARRS
jgi:hypothetical protein